MKNRTKFVGIIALVALVGFFFVACEGDRGPAGHLPRVTLGVLAEDESAVAHASIFPADVYATQGTTWNADFDLDDAGELPDGYVAGYGAWTDYFEDGFEFEDGIANFVRRFAITNPSAYEISVRVRIVNDHDFELHSEDPFYWDLTAEYPEMEGDNIWEVGFVTVPARVDNVDGTAYFWITAQLTDPQYGIANFGATGDPRRLDSLGMLDDFPTTAAHRVRNTVVIIEAAPGFAPWVNFPNGSSRLSFTFQVTLEDAD